MLLWNSSLVIIHAGRFMPKARETVQGEFSMAGHNQIRAFLIEQGIAVRTGAHALRKSLFPILDEKWVEVGDGV